MTAKCPMDPNIQKLSARHPCGHFDTYITHTAYTRQKLQQFEAFHFWHPLKSEKGVAHLVCVKYQKKQDSNQLGVLSTKVNQNPGLVWSGNDAAACEQKKQDVGQKHVRRISPLIGVEKGSRGGIPP